MDINNKKTALGEDSVLYQKRDDSLKKKDISSLSFTEKLQYFKDYYLLKVLAALAVLIFSGALIRTIFFTHQEHVLTVAVIGENYIADTEGLENRLREYFQLTDDSQLLYVTDYMLEDPNQQMAFSTKLMSDEIDLLICDPDYFTAYSGQGIFLDLSQVLPADLKDAFAADFSYGSQIETDMEGNVTDTLPEKPYGMDITENAVFKEYGITNTKAILGITATSSVFENDLNFLRFLLDLPCETTEGSAETEAEQAQ